MDAPWRLWLSKTAALVPIGRGNWPKEDAPANGQPARAICVSDAIAYANGLQSAMRSRDNFMGNML